MIKQRQSFLPDERKHFFWINKNKVMRHKEKEYLKSKNPFRAYVRQARLKKLRPIGAVLVLIVIWYALIGREILPDFIEQLPIGKDKEGSAMYYKANCSEASLTRMLVLCCAQNDYMEAIEKEKEGVDPSSQWFDKYYQLVGQLGVESLDIKNAFNIVDYGCLKASFTECFGQSVADIVLEEEENYQLYEILGYLNEALEKTGKGKMDKLEAAILASPSDEVPLEAWKLLTDKGMMQFEGLILDPLKNQTVVLAVVDDQILGVLEIKDTKCVVTHCKITSVSKEQVSYDVLDLSFSYENTILSKEVEGQLLDLTIENGKIIDYKMSQFEVVDTLLKVTDDYITFEKAGKKPYRSVAVSDATELDRFHSLGDLIYGVKVAYILEDDHVTALQVIGQSGQQMIRVVLTDENGNYEHKAVKIEATEDYDLLYKGKAQELVKGEIWESDKFSWQKDGSSVKLIPRGDSKLIIHSVEKGGEHPAYKGIIEITKTDEGYVIVNAIDIEEYVAGVLYSEMPASYETEALKAQAIAARTYGIKSLTSNRFLRYGANVDDTTNCQVYNRIAADKSAYEIAAATAGLVLKYDGQLTSNKFFATSCGYTANSGEVWADQNFPGNTPAYLSAEPQFKDQLGMKELSQEADFETFIQMGADELDAYDETSPWFRWQVRLTKEQLEKLLLPALEKLDEQKSSNVSYEMNDKEGRRHDIGSITGLEVRKRGEGGNIMMLAIQGEKGIAVVKTEYVIRSLFASNDRMSLDIVRNDSSIAKNQKLMPSAFFMSSPEIENGKLKAVNIIGGGFGHGVGLSQDGANGLAKEGKNFEEIIEHFYKGTKIVNLI